MTPRYLIWFWHGADKVLIDKIAPFTKEENGKYYFEGTLDEFASYYKEKFIVWPTNVDNLIAITLHKNFGQC